MGDILIMYLEDDLDRAYRIDCKLRSKTDLAWLKREEFRKVYEEMLNAHLDARYATRISYAICRKYSSK